jgi:hypothetical protein
MKKIITLTESDLTRIVKRVIEEQWWLAFAEAATSEAPGMGWGPDIDFGGGGSSTGGDPKSLNDTRVQLKKVRTLIQTATNLKNKINKRCSPYNTIKIPRANAGEIQDFLIAIGHNIGRDGLFGNQTATALGTYFYGAKLGINSVSKLQTKLNASFDKMETTVASKINTIVGEVKSRCNTELTNINKSLSNLNKIKSNLENLESKFSPKSTLRA